MQLSRDNTSANKITKALLIIYFIALFWILLFKLGVHFSYMEKRDINLIPFFSKGKIDLSGIILNVIIFIPAGIYAGVLFKRWSFVKNLFFFLLVSLVFEVLQFIFRIGAFDVTDIITNTIGGITGVIIFKAIEKLFKNSSKAQKFINIIAATATLLMILLLILLKMNMLPVRYQ
jgi:glycopeptide antibiotics resistance protein